MTRNAMLHQVAGQRENIERFLTRDDVKKIFERCLSLVTIPGALVQLNGDSTRETSVQWARNRAFLNRDVFWGRLSILISHRGQRGSMASNQFDDASLRKLVATAEERLRYNTHNAVYETREVRIPSKPHLNPTLWSDATAGFDGERRGETVRQIIAPAESSGLLAAGDLNVKSGGTFVFTNEGADRYYPVTRVDFSTTVRDPKGTGSGWAGVDDHEIGNVDFRRLAARALDKCQRSVNPVGLEPGRYTAILEPQAVADLWAPLFLSGKAMNRPDNEVDYDVWPFGKKPEWSKITEKVLDSRLSVRSDPMDPIGGFIPFDWTGEPYLNTRWIESGVLKDLSYGRHYAIERLGTEAGLNKPLSWRLDGEGTATVEEMIATTKRGVLVTRFHDVRAFHTKSWSCTGYTRDGLWLIENGKVTKPVKNFRFTESPLFAFNNVEQVGQAQRVFANFLRGFGPSWVAPPLKVRDFNFSQMSDAV